MSAAPSEQKNAKPEIGKSIITITSIIDVIPQPLVVPSQESGSGLAPEETPAVSAQAPDALVPAPALVGETPTALPISSTHPPADEMQSRSLAVSKSCFTPAVPSATSQAGSGALTLTERPQPAEKPNVVAGRPDTTSDLVQAIPANSLLPPVVVGGITYALLEPVMETEPAPSHGNGGGSASRPLRPTPIWTAAVPAQRPANTGPSERASSPPNLPSNASVESAALQPIVVGGLTYTRVDTGSAFLQPTPTVQMPAANPDAGGSHYQLAVSGTEGSVSVSFSVNDIPVTQGGGFITALRATNPVGQSEVIADTHTVLVSYNTLSNVKGVAQHSTIATTSGLVSESAELTALPGSMISRSASTISIEGSIVPAPAVFTIAGETFTAYPKGLAFDGTEVFEGSSAITISGTPFSLGTSDLIIGSITINLASVTGLGPALSSGLPAATAAGSISGSGLASTTGRGHTISHSNAVRFGPTDWRTILTMLVSVAAFTSTL